MVGDQDLRLQRFLASQQTSQEVLAAGYSQMLNSMSGRCKRGFKTALATIPINLDTMDSS
jgi:hypothetical protein